eukprot:scaffold152976_cov64-Cyclotella_meneghiniana.AAC.1
MFDEEVVERMKHQIISEQQIVSLILFSSQSRYVTPDEAPDHKDAKFLNSITTHDPYNSFYEGVLLPFLRQFAFDLGSGCVVGPKHKLLVDSDARLSNNQTTIVNKLEIRSPRGDDTAEACASKSMEKLITITEKLDIANMIPPLNMKAEYGVKAKMAIVIAQYLLRYLESNKTGCDGNLPGFYRKYILNHRLETN